MSNEMLRAWYHYKVRHDWQDKTTIESRRHSFIAGYLVAHPICDGEEAWKVIQAYCDKPRDCWFAVFDLLSEAGETELASYVEADGNNQPFPGEEASQPEPHQQPQPAEP
jgi:hypothetical protein